MFGPSGGTPLNDASATSIAIAPGATVNLCTSGVAGISCDRGLGLTGLLSKGSARVLTTTSFKASQSILCSSLLTDPGNTTPQAMTTLPVIRKTTQQGD
ncbi:MAG: hypothetical protein ACREI8_11785 [Myxococcota bacterium]